MHDKSNFHDFCHAWKTQFPHCEPPDIWEGDPQSNLAHHRAQVVCLRQNISLYLNFSEFLTYIYREELVKEEMCVESLEKY